MKKLISILTASLLTAGIMPFSANAAENDFSELGTLAGSLGADTDFLNITNYSHGISPYDNKVALNDFLQNNTPTEAAYSPMSTYYSVMKSDVSAGISLLEVLAHNGVISPSDILPDAENMSDITKVQDVDRIITYYNFLPTFTEFSNYEKSLTLNYSYDEQIDLLISTAEKCMSENRYFYVSLSSAKFSHAFCGIGIADGDWTWNDENFDKCILTLDTNYGTAPGYSPKSCIYVNSETKRCYVPAYSKGTDNDITLAAIDDDDLLNCRGMISPTEALDSKYRDMTLISLGRLRDCTTLYNVSEDGSMALLPDLNRPTTVMNGTRLHAVMEEEFQLYPTFRYVNADRWIDLELSYLPKAHMYSNTVDISENSVKIATQSEPMKYVLLQIRMNPDSFGYSENFWWCVDFHDADDEVEVEVRSDGMLIKSSTHMKACVQAFSLVTDDNGNYQLDDMGASVMTEHIEDVCIDSDNDVLVKINDEHEFEYYIDRDNDDVYEHRIEKGDLNFDGYISPTDASYALSIYSALSTGENIRYNKYLTDFNGDDMIGPADASQILAKYSELSTS